MKIRILPLVGWASMLIAYVLASDIVANHAAAYKVPLGGFLPRLDASTYEMYGYIIAVLLVVAWWLAIETSQYWLLITLAVVVGKNGQDFGHVFLGWMSSSWTWAFLAALLGIILALIREFLLGGRLLLPRSVASWNFTFNRS